MNTTECQSQMESVRWPNAVSAIAAILAEEANGALQLKFVCRTIGILLLAALISLTGTVLSLQNDSHNRYILTRKNGQVLPMVSLDRPNKPDQTVADWTVGALAELNTVDYVNYRKQLQFARRNLTAMGWKNHQKAMILSGNHKAILGNGFATKAVPVGEGRVASTGKLLGRHKWVVEFPMRISYHRSKRKDGTVPEPIVQNLHVTATVIRVPEHLNEEGLGIRSVIARDLQGSTPVPNSTANGIR